MAFRDETEALRQRARRLEEEIATLDRERIDHDAEARDLEEGVETRARIVSGGAWKAVVAAVPVILLAGVGAVMASGSNAGAETLYGTVHRTEGGAPVAEGARCTAFLAPVNDSDSDFDVHLDVLCDGRVVYGGDSGGYLACERPTRCVDPMPSAEDGDPALVYERLDDASIRVADRGWTLGIRLLGAREPR